MLRSTTLIALCTLCCSALQAGEITGHYMEARTCQVYTGPCFANGEVGLTGMDAVQAWQIQTDDSTGADLSGLKVAVIVRSSETIGFTGVEKARRLASMVLVDQSATPEQQEALVAFAKKRAGKAGRHVKEIRSAPIDMKLDTIDLTGDLRVGEFVKLKTRKARPGDCICSNESAYYPPLTQLAGFVPGVTIDGEVKARSLGTRWSIPDSRTAYMGTFSSE